MINKIIEKLPINIIPCQEASRLISLGMERNLSLKQRFDLKMHLYVCDLCTRFLKQVHALRDLMRRYHPLCEKQMPQEWKVKIKNTIITERQKT